MSWIWYQRLPAHFCQSLRYNDRMIPNSVQFYFFLQKSLQCDLAEEFTSSKKKKNHSCCIANMFFLFIFISFTIFSQYDNNGMRWKFICIWSSEPPVQNKAFDTSRNQTLNMKWKPCKCYIHFRKQRFDKSIFPKQSLFCTVNSNMSCHVIASKLGDMWMYFIVEKQQKNVFFFFFFYI